METVVAGLGTVTYEESDVLVFTKGLYGFEGNTRFLLTPSEVEELPFYYLKSLEQDELLFIVTNPFLFVEDYDFELPEGVAKNLGIDSLEAVTIYNLVVILEDIQGTTVNLKAPIIVNHQTMKACQIILAEDYAYKHPLFSRVKED